MDEMFCQAIIFFQSWHVRDNLQTVMKHAFQTLNLSHWWDHLRSNHESTDQRLSQRLKWKTHSTIFIGHRTFDWHSNNTWEQQLVSWISKETGKVLRLECDSISYQLELQRAPFFSHCRHDWTLLNCNRRRTKPNHPKHRVEATARESMLSHLHHDHWWKWSWV